MLSSLVLEQKTIKVQDRIKRLGRKLQYEYKHSAMDRVRKEKGLITNRKQLQDINKIEDRIQRLERELAVMKERLIELENTVPNKISLRHSGAVRYLK